MPIRPCHPRRAFTLIELVLVMMVMALLLAAAAPSLSGWGRGRRLDNAADGLLAATRYARSQALATSAAHRVEIDPESGAWLVSRQQATADYAPVPGEFGRPTLPAAGIRVEIERADDVELGVIDLYANGRISPVTVRLIADWGETATLASAGAAEPLRKTKGGAP